MAIMVGRRERAISVSWLPCLIALRNFNVNSVKPCVPNARHDNSRNNSWRSMPRSA